MPGAGEKSDESTSDCELDRGIKGEVSKKDHRRGTAEGCTAVYVKGGQATHCERPW